MATYKLTITKVVVEDDEYMTYGIMCQENGKEIARIDDISTDKRQVERTIALFNRGKLAPSQFEEAVEDSLI